MVDAFFSYPTSILNPLLKVMVIAMFAIGTWYFFRAGKKFGGNLGKIARLLMWGGIAGTIGTSFRYLGDFFTREKWLESTGALFFAVISLFVAYLVYQRFAEIAKAFGLRGDE